MSGPLATLSGTFLTPGVSANSRRYTRENIASAVSGMQAKIAAGQSIHVASGHGGRSAPTQIIGKVTSVSQAEDGSGAFTAALADTTTSRDVLALLEGPHAPLNAVSIFGSWEGPVSYAGGVETAPGLSIDGVDVVVSPGVDTAKIAKVERLREAASGRVAIWESAPEVHAYRSAAEALGAGMRSPFWEAGR